MSKALGVSPEQGGWAHPASLSRDTTYQRRYFPHSHYRPIGFQCPTNHQPADSEAVTIQKHKKLVECYLNVSAVTGRHCRVGLDSIEVALEPLSPGGSNNYYLTHKYEKELTKQQERVAVLSTSIMR